MKYAAALVACALLLAAVVPGVAADMPVQVAGAVAHPGTLDVKDGARLSAAALAASPQPDAYFLGAAWLRPSLRTQQIRLKAGILYDLGAVRVQALASNDPALAAAALSLHDWLSQLPVTGRRVPVRLAPRVVEATSAQNWPLAPGDTLFYPVRPSSVRVAGAVRRACTLPYQPLANARHYLAACVASPGADLDWTWVIQPDGRVFKRGIALWNLSRSALPLAPGALIYVPLRAGPTHRIDPDLNHEVAQFLATQTLPGPEGTP